MTPTDLLAECERVEMARISAGLCPHGAMMVVTVTRATRPKNWMRCRVLPGVYGRCVGELPPNGSERRFVVDVRASAVRAAVGREEAAR